MQALVSQVGHQIRESRCGIDAFAIPVEHAVDDKGVAKIVDAGSAATVSRLQSRLTQYGEKDLLRASHGVTPRASLVPEKRAVGIVWAAGTTTLLEVVPERGECTLGERQTT
jgi:hypothetical protein